MESNNTTAALLHITPPDVVEAAYRLQEFAEAYTRGSESYDDIGSVLNFSNDSGLFTLSDVELDISDTRSEKIHTFDSAALLLIMALLFLTVITIWVFKARRLRVFHETGLSLIYGECGALDARRRSSAGGYILISAHHSCSLLRKP